MRKTLIAISVLIAAATPAFAQAPVDDSTFTDLIEQSKSLMMADPARAYQLASEAETTANARAEVDPTEESTAKWLQGEALVRMNRVEEAKPVIDSALSAALESAGGSKLVGDLYMAQGMTARGLSDYATALDSYQSAHDVYAQLGAKRDQARALQQVGSIYTDAHDYERALDFYDRAGQTFDADPSLDLARLNNVGNAYRELGRYAEAEQGFRDALALAEQMNSPLLQSRILTNIASVQLAQGQIDQADTTARNGLALSPDGGGLGWEPFLWGVQAQIAYAREDYGRAATLIGRTFTGLDLKTTPRFFREFHETAHLIYAAMSQPRLALEHLEAFKRLDDEARDVSAKANLALMGAQFDFATQELEIANLRTDALEREVDLSRARARQRTILFGGVVLIFLIALAGGGIHYGSMRRSRNEIRLANDKLQSTNEALEKASKAKSEFLATTSHEIRTPLNGILGMTQLLMRQTGLAESVRERVELVHGAGETMKAIVDDILDVAKMETGAIDIHPENLELAAMLENVAQLWRDSAEKKNLSLDVDLANCPREIVGDPQRLRQISFNLLSNAIKFTEKGNVSLSVNTTTGANGDTLILSVTDTGCGIPAAELTEIFTPFHQVDGGTTRKQGGTGLGLAICRKLAEAMGGTVRATSTLEVGSEFVLEIPVQILKPATGDNTADSTKVSGYLLADPNPLHQSIIEAMWESGDGDLASLDTLDDLMAEIAQCKPLGILIASDVLSGAAGEAMEQLMELREAAPDAHLVVRLAPESGVEPAMLRLSGADEILEGAFDGPAAITALSNSEPDPAMSPSISPAS